jgi:uncharacterized protein involved in exopolysaccharide biosynthesis
MLDILKVVMKWRWQIMLFTMISAIAAIIITMPAIMPPYYKSKMIFYLSNPVSTDRAALFNEKEAGGVSMFGGKEDINRFLTILNSAPVIMHITKKYHLGEHYKIKPGNAQLYEYYTQKQFLGNFDAIRNDLGAIEVSVLDTDAKLASQIAHDAVMYSDSIYRAMLVQNKATVLELLETQIAEKTASGSNAINDAQEIKALAAIRDQYAVSASNNFKTIYVVEEPVPAIKKTRPVRWLILLATTLAAFFVASFTALLIELYRHADKYGFQKS